MKNRFDKGTVFMSVLISVLVVSLADLFLLSFFITFPKHKDINAITNAVKNPVELIHVAKYVKVVFEVMKYKGKSVSFFPLMATTR